MGMLGLNLPSGQMCMCVCVCVNMKGGGQGAGLAVKVYYMLLKSGSIEVRFMECTHKRSREI